MLHVENVEFHNTIYNLAEKLQRFGKMSNKLHKFLAQSPQCMKLRIS